jgi:murein DD-endopeptidase MepM/ murein hydrolase activator NlpD
MTLPVDSYAYKLVYDDSTLHKLNGAPVPESQFLYLELLKFFRGRYDNSIFASTEEQLARLALSDSVYDMSSLKVLPLPYEPGSTVQVVSNFGPRDSTRSVEYGGRKITGVQFHAGIDLVHSKTVAKKRAGTGLQSITKNGLTRLVGEPVTCVSDGKVVGVYDIASTRKKSYVSFVAIHHPILECLGDEGYTLYLHMSPILVRQNQEVRRGQVIGYESEVGSKNKIGEDSDGNPIYDKKGTGIHLHFEIRDKYKNALDPSLYLDLTEENLKENRKFQEENEGQVRTLLARQNAPFGYDNFPKPRAWLYGLEGIDTIATGFTSLG